MLSKVSFRTAKAASLFSRNFSTAVGNEVWILACNRTPIGSFQGALSSLTGVELGATCVKDVLTRAKVEPAWVEEAFLGNVISAGMGQAPAHQVMIKAGVPWTVATTAINKVCSSGMKSVMIGAQSIMSGQNNCVIAGGFESMSNIPYYLPKARKGYGYGHGEVQDGVLADGLTDAYQNIHMGNCAEICAKTYGFTRADQDKYAVESYKRSAEASAAGRFKEEIVSVTVKGKKGDTIVDTDEEFSKVVLDKIPTLKSAFMKDGTVTAANASSLNDGACAFVLANAKWAKEKGLKPIARIRGFADAGKDSVEFTTAPALALPKAFKNAGIAQKDVEYFELNEAFSVVSLANNKLLGLDAARVNVNGGAVSLGHPIGSSGGRILVTLLSVLKQKNAKIGAAAICNGGGGASAIVVERM